MIVDTLKVLSALGALGGACWFYLTPSVDFAAVLLGIVSLSVFMMTLLPIRTE
ncbi:MAG TPA: hypothetical protein VL528_02580 [Oxalicibacterium sp.]|jgi:hypothetical protein|nr:hypothetical protein [Oxalicibacterium sp.]